MTKPMTKVELRKEMDRIFRSGDTDYFKAKEYWHLLNCIYYAMPDNPPEQKQEKPKTWTAYFYCYNCYAVWKREIPCGKTIFKSYCVLHGASVEDGDTVCCSQCGKENDVVQVSPHRYSELKIESEEQEDESWKNQLLNP